MNAGKLLLTTTALLLLLATTRTQANANSKTGLQQHWSSETFAKGDLPCDRPTVPARFDVLQGRTPENAYLLMAASHLAYRFWPGRRERILNQWGFSNFHLFDDTRTSTNGFWAEHGQFVLVVFRGTQEPKDLLTDVSVSLVEAPAEWKTPGRLHRGFLTAAQAAEQHTKDAAELSRMKNKPLILAGHSLGGAIAVLSALNLEKKSVPINSVWSFGAPKFGDAEFTRKAQKILAQKWQSIVQPTDPIPQLPFAQGEKEKLKALAMNYGQWLPLIETLAENAAYDPVDVRASSKSTNAFVTDRSLTDIARGFWKHLPRSYVCDLATRSLPLHLEN